MNVPLKAPFEKYPIGNLPCQISKSAQRLQYWRSEILAQESRIIQGVGADTPEPGLGGVRDKGALIRLWEAGVLAQVTVPVPPVQGPWSPALAVGRQLLPHVLMPSPLGGLEPEAHLEQKRGTETNGISRDAAHLLPTPGLSLP